MAMRDPIDPKVLAPLTEGIALPRLHRVRQRWQSNPIPDIAAAVRTQLDVVGLRQRIVPGMRVALPVGSRGIRDIVAVLRATVAWLREAGAEPFMVTAMGSHGGATAEGQMALLAGLGITETVVECPLHASMEVVELGTLPDGTPVYLDRHAAGADGILAINRIKPHTSFKAAIESGIAKMCAVGLGNRHGAEQFHSRGVEGMRSRLVPMARMVVERGRVLAGLALLEDAYEQTAALVALPPQEIGGTGEAHLLERARDLMARLPFARLDVLVVDEIGKNISGTCMDTNVIGRLRIPGEADPLDPHIGVVVALDLSAASQGNAAGIGLADLIPQRLADKVDRAKTYMNNLTSGIIGLQRSALPITLPTPRDAVAMALRSCGQPDVEQVRLARIRNTLLLSELWVNDALLPEVTAHPRLEVTGADTWDAVL